MKSYLFVVVIALSISITSSAEILFFDDFDDGNADGWTEILSGSAYVVTSGWYCFYNTGPDDVIAASFNGDEMGSMSVENYTLRTLVKPLLAESGLMVRFSAASWQGYLCLLNPESNTVFICRFDMASSPPVVIGSTSCTMNYDEEIWVRFEVNSNLLGVKVWQGTRIEEPSTWLLVVEDSTYPDAGSIGLYAHDAESGGTATLEVDFDNVEVTDELNLVLDDTTWGEIKSLFE